MDIYKKILKISLKKLHSELQISENFIVGIHNEKNSWSFISKFAQFIEGFFTQILVERLGEKDTYETISNLPQVVRLNLAYDFKLISKEQKFLFLTIAEIRNEYIHDISNVEVSLSDYLQSLKNTRKTEIFKRFKPFIIDGEIESFDDFQTNCLDVIFTSCTLEITRLYNEIKSSNAEFKHAEFRAIQASKLLPRKADDAIFIDDKFMVQDYVKEAKEILKKAGLLKPKFGSKE